MVGPWAYGGFEGWHVERWLSNRKHLECRCVAQQNIDSGLCYMQCNCCFADSDSNIQLNVSPLLLLVCRQFDMAGTPHFLPHTALISQFALYPHLSQTNQA